MSKALRLIFAIVMATLLCVFATPGYLSAQAPPGPLPGAKPVPPSQQAAAGQAQRQTQPRTSIVGAWKLNLDDSDDGRKKMQQSRGQDHGNRSGGGGVHIGGRTGGRGGWGGQRGGGESDDDRRKMQEILNPSDSLTIVQKDAEFDLTDGEHDQQVFYTDGRKLKKSKDSSYQELAAHWDGTELTSDDKGPRGGKMTRIIELSPDGRQLYKTIHLDNGRSASAVVVRYVYDPAPAAETKQGS